MYSRALFVRRPPCWNSTARHARLDSLDARLDTLISTRSKRRTCRVVSRRDATSQVEFGLIKMFLLSYFICMCVCVCVCVHVSCGTSLAILQSVLRRLRSSCRPSPVWNPASNSTVTPPRDRRMQRVEFGQRRPALSRCSRSSGELCKMPLGTKPVISFLISVILVLILRVTTLWIRRLLWVNHLGQLSLPSLRGR